MGRVSEESGATGAGELGPYAEKVLDAVDLIPPGRVMTYGDVAEWLGEGGPRQVGRVMAEYGAVVPWWRVVRSDGVLLAGHEQRALAAYRAEGTPLRTVGPAAQGHIPRLDMRAARWDGLSPDGTRTPDGPGRAPGAGPEGAPGSAGGASGG
ncbi:MGMT family protein [Streptomyces sp. NPDC087270]|uniref:MGMT family protein n=1 Tax=unclassified Streptomyces TaxID=2593676 RepID=UPI0038075221